MVSQTRLIVFGGGVLSKSGLKTFTDWTAQRSTAPVLIVAWASQIPREAGQHTREAFEAVSPNLPTKILHHSPTSLAERDAFIVALQDCSGIFFTGGDQNRIADVFDYPEVATALQTAYRKGLPFGGTSAGTAIMSEWMIAGDVNPGALDPEQVRLRAGLGLVEGVIFDQHFLKRQRQNRLFAAVLARPGFVGIGVDEDTGLAIVDGELARVDGPLPVMRVHESAGQGFSSLQVALFQTGSSFSLYPNPSTAQAAS